MSPHIVLIVANPSISTNLRVPVGFWASELIHPYDAFAQAGCQVAIASPNGSTMECDSFSDRRDASGYSQDEATQLRANFLTKAPFSPHAVQDGNLITGQQQNSGTATAQLVLAEFGVAV